MHRRSVLAALPALFLPVMAGAHSPWGQYAVYRQKHLLVLSTRDDLASYPYSKLLVEAINRTAPEASARPARAKNLQRAYDLLRTAQFQFALLSSGNVDAMRTATGPFAEGAPVPLKTVYLFAELEFVVRSDFPENLVSIVTHALLAGLDALPDAKGPMEVLQTSALHSGARNAIEDFVIRQN